MRMENAMRNRTKLVGAVCVTLAGQAWAGPDEVMTEMMNMYTNTADPQILDTQRRGGLTLGRLSARTAVAAPNLIAYDPPSINGGCSGIDLYGGSFTFINTDQMTQALRAIASNAVSYAFTLAMESVCPVCMQQMQALRDQVDEINAMVRDSCQWATTLVDATPIKGFHEEQMKRAEEWMVRQGTVQDPNEAGQTGDTLYEKEAAVGPPQPINVVWEAMRTGNLSGWFGTAGDNELLEVLMSVTGTIVKDEVNFGGTNCDDGRGVA